MQRLAPFPFSDKAHPTLALPGWTVPAWIAGIVVAGAALRVLWAFQVGLHPDEALYASWALRIADGSDPALLGVYVDKPPFLPYLLAAVAWLMGSEPAAASQLQHIAAAGRLAAAGAGLLSLALLWSIAQPLYGRRVAALAVALLAASPLAIRLSPSLLTDPWLALFMLLGLWAALRGRPWLTGIACGLAFASKQQALLIIPLVVAAFFLLQSHMHTSGAPPNSSLRGGRRRSNPDLPAPDFCTSVSPNPSLRGGRRRSNPDLPAPGSLARGCRETPPRDPSLIARHSAGRLRDPLRMTESEFLAKTTAVGEGIGASQRSRKARRGDLWRLVCGFALVATVVLWWDSQRWQWMPSYWQRSATTYGGLALVAVAQLGQHLAGWMAVLATVLGLPLLLLTAILWGGRLVVAIRRPRPSPACSPEPDGARRFDALLALFLACYLAVHLATGLAPWDRYALPLAPILALLLARIVFWWSDRLALQGRRPAVIALAAVVAAGMLWATALAASPRFPVADNSTYDGVPAIAEHIRDREPPTAIVYHHWFGWHYGYYLYGTDLDLRWWQSPADLARQAVDQPGRQLVALPSAEDRAAVETALAQAGLALRPLQTVSHRDGSLSAVLFSVEPAGGAGRGD